MANEDDPRFPSQTADKYVVRFPDGMRDRIAEAAKANKRSMNAEIVARLEGSLDGTSVALPERLRDELVGRAEASGLPFDTVFIRTLVDALDDHPDDALADPVIVDQARQIWRMRHQMVLVHLALVGARWQLEAHGAAPAELKAIDDAKAGIWEYVKDWAEMTFEEVNAERSRLGFVPLLPEQFLPLSDRAQQAQERSRALALAQAEKNTSVRRGPVPPTAEGLRRELNDPDAERRSTRQVTNEFIAAGVAEDEQPTKEPTPQTAEEMRREVEEANAAYLAAKRRLDRLSPQTAAEPVADTSMPVHRLARLTKAKKGAK